MEVGIRAASEFGTASEGKQIRHVPHGEREGHGMPVYRRKGHVVAGFWLMIVLLPAGCGGPSVDASAVEEREGVVYVVETDEPFTGTVRLPFPDTMEAAPDVVAREAHYRRGLLDGTTRGFYPSGAVAYELEFRKGLREGERVDFWENGTVRRREEFRADTARGILREWDPEGHLIKEQELADGKPNGVTRTWYPDGTLESEATYLNGALHGTLRRWHPNGQLRMEREYRNGFPHGPTREWAEDGTLLVEGSYDKGKVHGPYRRWYPNGQPAVEAEYYQGRSLAIRMWDEEGNPVPVEPDLHPADTLRLMRER